MAGCPPAPERVGPCASHESRLSRPGAQALSTSSPERTAARPNRCSRSLPTASAIGRQLPRSMTSRPSSWRPAHGSTRRVPVRPALTASRASSRSSTPLMTSGPSPGRAPTPVEIRPGDGSGRSCSRSRSGNRPLPPPLCKCAGHRTQAMRFFRSPIHPHNHRGCVRPSLRLIQKCA